VADRTFGSPNPFKASILRNDPDFQTSRSQLSADQRQAAAKHHVVQRNRHALQLLLALSAMTSASQSPGSGSRRRGLSVATVNSGAAILQRHSYPEPDQGAHFLPGQVYLNGRTPWTYVANSLARLYVMDMFANVERLHRNFNTADSQAEKGPHGLTELMTECATRVVHHSTGPTDGRSDRQFVYNVFTGLWLPGHERSLLVALNKKQARPQVPDVSYAKQTFQPWEPESFDPHLISNLDDIQNASTFAWNNEEVIKILQASLPHARTGPGAVELSDLADHAESALKGHEEALKVLDK
jgi:hypothetical protein